jgi:hypothetical protein
LEIFLNNLSGNLNPQNAHNNPEIYPQGIHISHQKHIFVSDTWKGDIENGTYALIWYFNIEGEFGTFVDIKLEVSLRIK